jgi:hypothetical protein
MVKSNGNGVMNAEEYHRRGREVDDTLNNLRAERDRIDRVIEQWEQRREEVAHAAAMAGVAELAEQGVRRSLLTAKQKSEITREKGKDFYDALPW